MAGSDYDDDDFELDLRKFSDYLSDEEEEKVKEEEEVDQELDVRLSCPYCLEGFDALELFIHLEYLHQSETKSGVCPICSDSLGMDMVPHLVIQHDSTLKSLHKGNLRGDGSCLLASLLKKSLDLYEESRYKKSSSAVSTFTLSTDSSLLPFVQNPPQVCEQLCSSEPRLFEENLDHKAIERYVGRDNMGFHTSSHRHQAERPRRYEYIQTLLLSTFLEDNL